MMARMIFYFKEIIEKDVHEVMFKIKAKKSFGNDYIYGYFVKIAFPYNSRII